MPGKNLNKLTTVDLGIVNEFHIRGRKATMELGKKMNLSARSLGKLQRPLLKADMLAASTRPFPTRRAKPHGTGALEFHELHGSDGPQYGNVASLEAAKRAFRAAWDRRPKASGKS